MVKRLLLTFAMLAVAGIAFAQGPSIVAHRGYWNDNAQNSIASLKKAQEFSCWGSECDVHLTADNVVVVNHDRSIGGTDIQSSPFQEVRAHKLANGEPVPTLDEYLDQAAQSESCILVLEIKPHTNVLREDMVIHQCLEGLKAHQLLDPTRVVFISFSYHICQELARMCPGFTVQYLNGDKTPAQVAADGINGIDYHYSRLVKHPEWVLEAHALGMSVNAWTVDREDDIRKMIGLGVDQITTNNPLLVQQLLQEY